MNLSKKDKRTIFIGSIAGIAILVYTYVIDPIYSDKNRISNEITKKIKLINKYNDLLKSEKFVTGEFKAAKSVNSKIESYFLTKESPSLAAAELQKILNEQAKAVNLSIESEKVIETYGYDIFMVVPVEIIIKSNLRNIMGFLYGVENGEKLIDIEKLSMKIIRNSTPLEEELIESKIVTKGYYFFK
jgi:hypothetical protein